MNTHESTQVILEATPENHIRRRLDWTEPLVEGDHQLNPTIAGDD